MLAFALAAVVAAAAPAPAGPLKGKLLVLACSGDLCGAVKDALGKQGAKVLDESKTRAALRGILLSGDGRTRAPKGLPKNLVAAYEAAAKHCDVRAKNHAPDIKECSDRLMAGVWQRQLAFDEADLVVELSEQPITGKVEFTLVVYEPLSTVQLALSAWTSGASLVPEVVKRVLDPAQRTAPRFVQEKLPGES